MKKNKANPLNAITLFSGIGIDEFNLPHVGVNVKLACELSPKRVDIYKQLHSTPRVICGDLSDASIKSEIIRFAQKEQIDLLIATPPCQGVSWAGMNKSRDAILGDPRNFLVLNAIEIFEALSPDYFIIENVPRFQDMLFPSSIGDKMVPLKTLLEEKYSSKYEISVATLNAADYGVPQTRFRIVYRLWKKGLLWGEPSKEKAITLREAIGDLPALEAGEKSSIPNHFARKIPANHVECLRHTPTGMSAFDNADYFPKKKNGEKIKGFNLNSSEPCEVEHIIADHYEQHQDEFASINEFVPVRNGIGDLLVLPKSFNASYGDKIYEEKVKQYFSQNILAQSLNQQKYQNNPGVLNFINRTELPFAPYEHFGKKEIDSRADLYKRILQWNWDAK